jgi:methionyl-tRNA formyltransferase
MLKIIYAGTPEFAVPALNLLLHSEHDVLAVYTQPDRPAGRGRKLMHSPVKDCALEHDIPVFQPQSFKDSSESMRLSAFNPDVMVVAAYGLLLPNAVLEAPRLGCINIHASLLPRWRGAAPIQRAILAADAETGITIMQMDQGLDTGDILAKSSLPILPEWTSADLHDQLKLLGAELLIETLKQVESGEVNRQPQDNAGATYARRLEKAEARIDWNKNAGTIQCETRAYVPWPVSYTYLKDKSLRVWRAEIDTSHDPLIPGQIVEHNRNGLFVSCKDSVLQITELQFAGKKRLTAAEALNAKNLTGMHFDKGE